MTDNPNLRTGGQILVDQLRIHGADTIFCVPGESYLATLDALFDVQNDIKLVVCRQEGGASYMAEAYGKLTGKPGICFVTRGPGATNASLGIHTAHQDSSPVILLVGQVGRAMMDREAFQEVNFREMYAPLSKWVTQIDDPNRIPEVMSRAFHVATSGRPGPVVIALPEDMQKEKASVNDAIRYTPINAAPPPESMIQLKEMLGKAKNPFVILGGSGWTKVSCNDFIEFAENFDLPVGAAFRRQDLIDNRHPNYAGDVGLGINPPLAKRLQDTDLLIVVGAQMTEIITDGYERFAIPCPSQTLVHVAAGLDELARVYEPELAIHSGMANFAAAAKTLNAPDSVPWSDQTKAARADQDGNVTIPDMKGDVDLGAIIQWLGERLPDDAIVANGAGNFSNWVHRFYPYRSYPTELAPQSGSMGYGVPAAVAAKTVHPDRIVVSFSGDGDFLMCGQEIATARQYNLGIVFVVVNNGTYGTIRMHQEKFYPGRVSGTDLVNPDFAALGKAYGLTGEVVDSTEQFAPAFERALESGGPAMIEVRVEQDQISPRATLSGLREAGLAEQKG
ncbi:MAG: thiamine pyrophosphate-binding protein [Alphaproteobacteria bacterium]|nr:thiamine pyrophosphate-binding protein [Alphaproteobacteria bacterium]